jgi:hypothetical protein
MTNKSTSKSFTASLNEPPFGDERFRIGRTLNLWTAAMSGFDRKPSHGGESKGPATNPFFSQVANTSVIAIPLSVAVLAFFSRMGGRRSIKSTSFSPFRFLTALAAVIFSDKVQSFLQKSISFSNSRTFTPPCRRVFG